MLKVIAACGNGMGSSLMVKMKIQEVLKEKNIPATVEHMSVGDAKNVGNSYDVVFVSQALANGLNFRNTKVIPLKNLLSKDEISTKVDENNLQELV